MDTSQSRSVADLKAEKVGNMARKKNEDYFETFVKLVDYTCQAAHLLN